MPKSLTLEASISEILFNLATPETRLAVEEEVAVLLDRYAPGGGELDLRAAELALSAQRDLPPHARLRLRLWAAAIRRRIASQSEDV